MGTEKCKPVREVGFSEMERLVRTKPNVLVQFAASWCGACQKSKPEVDKAACELSGEAEVVRVDVDKNPYATAKYKVEAYPTVISFKDGKQIARTEGAEKSEKYVKLAKK